MDTIRYLDKAENDTIESIINKYREKCIIYINTVSTY